MGHYTALKVENARLTEIGAKIVKDLHEAPHDRNRWEWVADLYPHFPFLKDWSKKSHCDFFPFGSSWIEIKAEWSLNEGIWSFVCSLKNYEGEIEYFLEFVLPNLIETPTFAFTKNDMQDDDGWNQRSAIAPIRSES